MKKLLVALMLFSLTALSVGCANVSPFSPRQRQQIANEGKIEEIKTNQDSINAEIGNLRNTIEARDIASYQAQTGKANKQNSGVQILSGDGALMVVLLVGIVSVVVIVYYKNKAGKSKKTAEILASALASYDNSSLDDGVFMAAMNTEVESDVYHLMVRKKRQLGLR